MMMEAAQAEAGVPTDRSWKNSEEYQPTQNLCPGRFAAVIVCSSSGKPAHLCTKRWGLIPGFDKAATPDYWKMFNARSETLTTSPVFRRLLKDRRCAVPFDGFFEWTEGEKLASDKAKQPYYVHRKSGSQLWLAGLHDVAAEGTIESFALITRDVSSNLAWLHDRMPVLLDAEGLACWLSPTDEGQPPPLDALRSTIPPEELAWHPTTKRMSKVEYQEADVASPAKLASQEQKSVASFFSKRPERATSAHLAEAAAASAPKAPPAAAAAAAASAVSTSRAELIAKESVQPKGSERGVGAAADAAVDAGGGADGSDAAAVINPSGGSQNMASAAAASDGDGWACITCTYHHHGSEATFLTCAMCGAQAGPATYASPQSATAAPAAAAALGSGSGPAHGGSVGGVGSASRGATPNRGASAGSGSGRGGSGKGKAAVKKEATTPAGGGILAFLHKRSGAEEASNRGEQGAKKPKRE